MGRGRCACGECGALELLANNTPSYRTPLSSMVTTNCWSPALESPRNAKHVCKLNKNLILESFKLKTGQTCDICITLRKDFEFCFENFCLISKMVY